MEVHPIPYAIFAQDDKVRAYSNSASLFSQGRSQNLKEVPQNFKEFLTLMTSQLIAPTSQRKK